MFSSLRYALSLFSQINEKVLRNERDRLCIGTAAESVLDSLFSCRRVDRIGMWYSDCIDNGRPTRFRPDFREQTCKTEKIMKDGVSIANYYCFRSMVLGVLDVSLMQGSYGLESIRIGAKAYDC